MHSFQVHHHTNFSSEIGQAEHPHCMIADGVSTMLFHANCKMCEQPVANTTWERSLFSPWCESRAIAQLVTELSADPVPDDVPIPLRLAVCPSVSRSQCPPWCFSALATKLKPLDKLRQSRPPAVQNPHVLHTLWLEGYKSHALSGTSLHSLHKEPDPGRYPFHCAHNLHKRKMITNH